MDRNTELAEMVVNKEIDLEEAKRLTDDIKGLMDAISVRRSMRYALQSAMLWYRIAVLSAESTYANYAYARYMDLVQGYSSAALVDIGELYGTEGMITEKARDLGLHFLDDDLTHLNGASGRLNLNLDPEDPDYRGSVTAGEFQKEIVDPAYETAVRRGVGLVREKAKAEAYPLASFAQLVGESIQMIANALLY